MGHEIKIITIRLRVFAHDDIEFPDRVRVVVKQRDAIFIPYWKKITSIILQQKDWRHTEGTVWCNEQAVKVPMQLEQLLKREKRQLLTLQLYCLCGRTVQHKALGRFTRLMHQMQECELYLTVHCPGSIQEVIKKTLVKVKEMTQEKLVKAKMTLKKISLGTLLRPLKIWKNEGPAANTQPVEIVVAGEKRPNERWQRIILGAMLVRCVGLRGAVCLFLLLGLGVCWWCGGGRHILGRIMFGKEYKKIKKH